MRKEDKTLRYEGLELPESLSDILKQDFWVLDNIGGMAVGMLHQPMKFTSSTAIFVRQGHCKFEINLQEYEIEAPCLVNIASADIMQPVSISSDFVGAFMVMSKRFIDDFKREVDDARVIGLLKRSPLIQIPSSALADFEIFFSQLRTLTSNSSNPYIYKAVLHALVSFFFYSALPCISQERETGSTASHITTNFLKLARENFKKERFMEFYAKELGITSKHLGRTIKAQTGFTASEWLDRMVILEAKVLLKSSAMTIQQIAEELNFPSQSFFGKYFKNIVGVSPKEFRNA